MPRISSPRPLDLTKPFVTSSQSYGSQPFDLSQNLVTWYRDIQRDFSSDLSGRGNDARVAGSGSFQAVTSSASTPEFNSNNYGITSLGFGLGSTSTTISHLRVVDKNGNPRASDDHTFADDDRDIPFSISFWMRTESSSTQAILTKILGSVGYEWQLLVNGTALILYLYDNASTSNFISFSQPGVISTNSWSHVVITYDGRAATNSVKIYVNTTENNPTGTVTNSYSKMTKSSTPMVVGSNYTNVAFTSMNTQRFRGSLHSLAIWKNRVISSSEVSALYYAYVNGPGGEARSGFISRSPRLHLHELDDLSGAYSTVRRTGDPTRTGTLNSNFNDETSIIFDESGTAVFPSMLPKGSSFSSQAVDIIGQESDISASLPIRAFQQPSYLHYSPTEEIGPFDENRVIPATDFFLSGTDETILPRFQSPMRSKASFVIDITPETDTTFTRNVAARNTAEGQPAGSNNTGFMYYNFVRREWEQIGTKDPTTASSLYYDYDISSYDLSSGVAPSGTLPAQFSVSPTLPYVPDSEKEYVGYSKIGTPISAFGAPSSEMYHATASQCLRMSDYVSDPFLLEAVRVEFNEIKAQRIQGDSFVGTADEEELGLSGLFQSGSIRDIDNYMFFMYRQSRKNRIVDSVADVSSSERYLVLSGAMTFWNSASFESNRVRYENQEVNFGLTHTPAFSYEFGLPYSSSLDIRLTDWDPSNDTYYVDDAIFDVTSDCVAHFNFENDATGGDTVPDKAGNGHVATVEATSVVEVYGSGSVGSVGFPTTKFLGEYFFDAGAYITSRGYLQCSVIGTNFPSMRINHASDLQMTLGQGFSISLWVKPALTPVPNSQWILSKADDSTGAQVEYFIQALAGGQIRWRVYGTGGGYIQKTTVGDPLDNTGWTHLIVSYSGGTNSTALKIFINGEEVNSSASTGGTFTAPTNFSQNVLVGALGNTTFTFYGYIGSLEFYSSNISPASARKLYLLQETPFLNTPEVAIGQFTGSIDMNLKPAICNRQSFGVSAYSNSYLQNVWLGGSSFRKFNESSWEVYDFYPANPFEVGNPGGIGAGDYYGTTIDDGRFSTTLDSRASRFLGRDSAASSLPEQQIISDIFAVNDGTEQGTVSPYLLMPDDELIFGIDSGICSMRFLRDEGNLSHLTGSHLVISSKRCKVTLFGSLVKNGSEFSTGLNQDLSSNSIHEVIGAEPVLDQFMIEPRSSYYGSYLDEIVTGNMAILNPDGTTFTIYDQDNSRRVVGRILT